ncbi:MAG TPA: YdeI/OmpD-associated family protein [Bryobacteraceae bacterium]
MHPAGLAAFEQRDEAKSAIYSYEQRYQAKLSQADEDRFRANKRAWKFFQGQAPWYRRTATHWVVSAKKEETKRKRLEILISDSQQGQSIGPLRRPSQSRPKRR